MSLPAYSPLTPPRPTTLAQAVEQVRHPRNHATAQLKPHREELLRLRQTGESVGSLAGGLRQFGIDIGHETLRLWLNRELGRKPIKRRRRAAKPAAQSGITASASPVPAAATTISMPPT